MERRERDGSVRQTEEERTRERVKKREETRRRGG